MWITSQKQLPPLPLQWAKAPGTVPHRPSCDEGQPRYVEVILGFAVVWCGWKLSWPKNILPNDGFHGDESHGIESVKKSPTKNPSIGGIVFDDLWYLQLSMRVLQQNSTIRSCSLCFFGEMWFTLPVKWLCFPVFSRWFFLRFFSGGKRLL